MNIIVCDLDNTLCNDNWRGHLGPSDRMNNQKEWEPYHLACSGDEPYPDILGYLNKHGPLSKVIFSTGRGVVARKPTIEWLNKHLEFEYECLLMRTNSSSMEESAVDFKPRMVIDYVESNLLQGGSFESVKKNVLAIDDDKRLICKWSQFGVKTWYVKRKPSSVKFRY